MDYFKYNRLSRAIAVALLSSLPILAQAASNPASENKLTVVNNLPKESFVGGYSQSDKNDANKNEVTIKNGTNVKSVTGGFVDVGTKNSSSSANSNSVIMEGGEAYSIYGGFIKSESTGLNIIPSNGNSNNNSVIVNNGSVDIANGGVSFSGNADNNEVIINSYTPRNQYGISVVGGTSTKGSATGNRVVFNGGKALSITGGIGAGQEGLVSDNVAANNSVEINSNDLVYYAYGGESKHGNSINNTVTVNSGTVIHAKGGLVYGGMIENLKKDAINNSLVINGGTVNTATGGTSNGGNATGNKVIINDGYVVSTVGGSSNIALFNDSYSKSSNNSVVVNGGTVVSVIGGDVWSLNDSANNNTVTITGNAKFLPSGLLDLSGSGVGGLYVESSIYGGLNPNASFRNSDVFTGNTLNFSAAPVSVGTVGNFEKYNFTLNPEFANTKTALITADEIRLGYTENAPAKIEVVGIHAGKALNAADDFVLMRANDSLLGYGEGVTSKGVAQQGIALLYDIETKVDAAGKVVTATVLGNKPGPSTPVEPSIPLTPLEPSKPIVPTTPPVEQPGTSPETGGSNSGKPAGRINPQLKALSEGYIAGAMLVNRGADTAAFDAFDAIDTQNSKGGLAPFVTLSASRTRYNSGSHVKSNDVVLSSGLSFKQDNITLGAFLETGRGSYDSYNSFSNAAKVHGSGNTRYYGAGLLGRYTFDSKIYTDASVRFGRTRTKFDTSDIQNLVTGDAAKYNLRSNYLSAHIGAGYVLTLNDKNSLDLSAKYLRSTVDGAKADIAGDSIDFDRVNSDRVRANALFSHAYSETVSFNAGVGYEHEFDSKTKATARTVQGNLSIDAPDVKGGTGIFSLGATVTPSADKNFSLDFNIDAYTGKREGAGASIRAGYAF